MQVKTISTQRNYYALFFALSTFPAVWLGVKAKTEAVVAIGAIAVAFLIMLIRKNRLLYDATLIWDNRILTVSSVFIDEKDCTGRIHTEETLVSAFGILIGAKIYKWGHDGIHGKRLRSIGIDRQRIILVFGDATRSMRIELLHGMTDQKEVLDVKQKFWHETGVSASINGW